MISRSYKDLDGIFLNIKGFLKRYNRSEILQEYFLNMATSLFYGNVINNFFINLNKTNINELKIPKGNIGKIKNKYKDIRKDVSAAFQLKNFEKTLDKIYYIDFKNRIKAEYPEYEIIINEIEKQIKIEEAEEYLKRNLKEIKECGKQKDDLRALITTKIFEVCIQKKKRIILGKDLRKSIKVISTDVVNEFTENMLNSMKEDTQGILTSKREYLRGFEERLYSQWKEPIDLFEYLIMIASESGEEHANKIIKAADNSNDFQRSALIEIHARALQISNEILVLVKSGFADGAFARWRSLHELAVISIFLLNNNNEVSKRYLEHEIIKRFKEARDYRTYYKKLGYPSASRKEFNKLKRERDKLCNHYNDKFQRDYGWIPSAIVPSQDFRALEKHVKLDKLRLFYNISNDAVHGGSKGFYRLGLMDDMQNKALLVGPSNYGLADPIQNASISLLHVCACLLSIEPDFESVALLKIMNEYKKEICLKVVNIQNQIELDEANAS